MRTCVDESKTEHYNNTELGCRRVPIYRIDKISAADITKFSISAIGIFYQYFYQHFTQALIGDDSFNNALFSCHHFLLC